MSTIPALNFASGADVVTCGDMLTGGLATLCVEGWFRVAAISSANRPLVMKYGTTGHDWALYVTRDGRAYWTVFSEGGVNVAYAAVGAIPYVRWVHVAGCYDGTNCKVFIDGADATVDSRVAGGTVVDTAQAVQIGGFIGQASAGFVGRAGWCQVSDVCRYPAAVAMPDQYPSADGNTLGLWHVDEGTGSTLDNETGTAAYDGTISGATWATSLVGEKRRAQAARPAGWWATRTWAVAPLTGAFRAPGG